MATISWEWKRKESSILPSRLLSLPVSCPSLVLWIYLLNSIFIFLISLVLNIFYIQRTGRDFPLLSYGFFIITMMGICQAYVWYFGSNIISFIPFMILFAPILIYMGCFKYQTSMPLLAIKEIFTNSWSYFLSIGSLLVLSYSWALIAVKKRRCGEHILILNLEDKIIRRDKRKKMSLKNFPSSLTAQLWFENMNTRGYFPLIVLGWIVVFVLLIIVSGSDFDEIKEGFWGSLIILFIACLMLGTLKIRGAFWAQSLDLGTFRSVRPISSIELSYTIMKSGLNEILTTILIFIFSLVFGFMIITITGHLELGKKLVYDFLHSDMLDIGVIGLHGILIFFFGIIFLAWVFLGNGMALCLTGRKQLIISVYLGIAVSILCIFFIFDSYPGSTWAYFLRDDGFKLLGTTLLLGTLYGYFYAVKLIHISKIQIIKSAVLGIILFLIVYFLLHLPMIGKNHLIYISVGLSSLGISSFAVAPLALHWNRHR
jgi:hypothetical protein